MGDQRNRSRDGESEVLSRVRRIETRLTQFMIAQGVSTESQKPKFAGGDGSGVRATVLVPSKHTTLNEIVGAIPAEFQGPVDLYVGDTKLGSIARC